MRSLILRLIALGMLLLLVAACEAEATPVAAVVPDTPTAAFSTATAAPPLHYAVAANANDFIPTDERTTIAEAALIDQLGDDATSEIVQATYDVVTAYGLYEDWQVSPVSQQITVIMNPALPPLDENAITEAIRTASDVPAIIESLAIPGAVPIMENAADTTIRAALANAGYPDGIVLSGIYENLPGAELWLGQLQTNNIEIQATAAPHAEVIQAIVNGDVHIALIALTSDEQRAELEAAVGAENIIPLYEVGISYAAAPGIDVTFTASGWPIPSRSTPTEQVPTATAPD